MKLLFSLLLVCLFLCLVARASKGILATAWRQTFVALLVLSVSERESAAYSKLVWLLCSSFHLGVCVCAHKESSGIKRNRKHTELKFKHHKQITTKQNHLNFIAKEKLSRTQPLLKAMSPLLEMWSLFCLLHLLGRVKYDPSLLSGAVLQWLLRTEYGEGVCATFRSFQSNTIFLPRFSCVGYCESGAPAGTCSVEGYYIMRDPEATHVAFRDTVALHFILDWYAKDKPIRLGTGRK